MKFTKDWLDIHLKSKKKESQIIDKLNNIGLEVEKIEPIKNELSDFIIAKIIKADKHPNADRLKLCEVDICLLYTSPSPRDLSTSRMPSSA